MKYQLNKLPSKMTDKEIPSTTCMPNINLYWAVSGRVTQLPHCDCRIQSSCSYYLKEGCFLKDKKEFIDK
jgi:hypothetical protein